MARACSCLVSSFDTDDFLTPELRDAKYLGRRYLGRRHLGRKHLGCRCRPRNTGPDLRERRFARARGVVAEALDQRTVQIDETLQKSPRRIELDREPPFREIDLDDMCAFLQAVPDFAFRLVEKIIEVILPRIAVDAALRIQQTQGGRRNDGLLDRHMCSAGRSLDTRRPGVR
jgi:hypothetical protein